MARKHSHKSATFIGIDLAWSGRNRSGGAVIQNSRLVAATGRLGDLEEIVGFIGAHLTATGAAIVAVDAPIRVPNQTGMRACDRAISADWRPYQAGAYPANRQLLGRNGTVRGEVLVQTLVERHRFTESCTIPRRSHDRLICEVYPHPAHVSLFGLKRTLKYKRGRGRRYEDRWPEFERYQRYLRHLRRAKPPLKKTRKLLKGIDVRTLRGRALQEYEDTLDAITCAYVGYYLWWHGPGASLVYGSLASGHIVVPVSREMRARLAG